MASARWAALRFSTPARRRLVCVVFPPRSFDMPLMLEPPAGAATYGTGGGAQAWGAAGAPLAPLAQVAEDQPVRCARSRSTASVSSTSGVVSEMRKKPSPLGPYMDPGETTTPASSSTSSAKDVDVCPSGTGAQM